MTLLMNFLISTRKEQEIAVRIDEDPTPFSIVQAYARTGASDEEIERFYSDLEELLNSLSRSDVLLTLGDFNAKVGQRRTVYLKFFGN